MSSREHTSKINENVNTLKGDNLILSILRFKTTNYKQTYTQYNYEREQKMKKSFIKHDFI